MTQLHYHRWQNEFEKADFSSEASMRDYLYRNPAIVVAKSINTDEIIPIGEEVSLPESKLSFKDRGRADIIFAKLNKNDQNGTSNDKNRINIKKENVELWICELKKVEATYQNGLEQLLDYMSTFEQAQQLQNNIMAYIIKWYKDKRHKEVEFDNQSSFVVCGALVAPSFDLYTKISLDDMSNNDKWEQLQKIKERLNKSDDSITMFDIVREAQIEFGKDDAVISLNKVIRFIRSDEEVIFSENALGQAAAAQARRDIDPKAIVNGMTDQDNEFYFIDNEEKPHEDVVCRLLSKRGRSNSFIIKLFKVGASNEIYVVNDKNKPWSFIKAPLPIELTTRKCSMSLHRHFMPQKYAIDTKIFEEYATFSEKNFIRRKDGKRLSELRRQ